MIRKWLARLMIALMVAIMGYFIFLSTDMTWVPIEEGGTLTDENAQGELARGRGVNYLRVDSEGNEIMSGSSVKFSQLDEENVRLADGLRIRLNEGGTLYEVRADRLEQDGAGNKIMYADGDGIIELASADGLTIRTAGPLVQTPQDVLQTTAEATFAMGEARGRCLGLRFKPDVFLELSADALFQAQGEGQKIDIQADSIRFDNLTQTGLVRGGIIQSHLAATEGVDVLIADEILLNYRGGQKMTPFQLINARLTGDDAEFIWQEGRLVSHYFMICFDQSGKQVKELYTAADARFDIATADGYALFGAGGQLVLTVDNTKPTLLTSIDPVRLFGEKAGAPPVQINGDKGLKTTFTKGRAASTEVFGMPSFKYGAQSGEAGNLRLMHQDADLMFSDRAVLRDSDQDMRVQADRILVSDWDTDRRQLFAFDFVDILFGSEEGRITGRGDTMEYKAVDNHLVLTGQPARATQDVNNIAAERIEVTQVDEETYDMTAEKNVVVNLALERGLTAVEASRMRLMGREQKVMFDNVIRAEMPGVGSLTCGYLEAGLKERNGAQILEYLIGSNDLILEGTVLKDGEPEPMSCRADRMTYRAAEEAIHFEGEGRDLVFTHPDHNLRGRHLTYNLKDGSIRLGSEKQGPSKSSVNL